MPDITATEAQTPEQERLEELSNFGPYVSNVFYNADRHRQESLMEEELLKCLRQSRGEFDIADKELIAKMNAPTIYQNISDTKRRAANAWIQEIFLNSAKPAWVMKPTPVPEISPADAQKITADTANDFMEYQMMKLTSQGVPQDQAAVMVFENPPDADVFVQYALSKRDEMDNKRKEVAKKKVDRMATLCHDQIVEGDWKNAMDAMVDCASTFGTGLLVGPIRRMKQRTRFDKTNGVKLKNVEVWEWEHINPLDAFPAKGAVKITDGDFCQRVKYTPKELYEMGDLGEGYYQTSIDSILVKYPNGGLSMNLSFDPERKLLENDGTARSYTDTMIEGIKFWGDIRGSMLIENQITEYDGKPIDEKKYYETHAIVIDKEVIFCSMTDPTLGRNVFKGTFYKTQGSWWGDSPMNKMRTPQRYTNSSLRSMCINMAQSSGPVGFLGDKNRLMPGDSLRIDPWSIKVFKDVNGKGDIPLKIFQAASNSKEYMEVMDWASKQADILTGIPAYSHGSQVAAGAGRTMGGLAMLMAAATRGLKQVVSSLSFDVLVPALTYQYRINMLFEKDPGIKGDAEVDVGGVLAILNKDQNAQRLMDFLTLAQAPGISNVLGKRGISEIVRTYVNLLEGINPDNVVPSRDEMERIEQMDKIEAQLAAQQQNAPQGGGGQLQLPAGPSPTDGINQPNGNALSSPEAPMRQAQQPTTEAQLA